MVTTSFGNKACCCFVSPTRTRRQSSGSSSDKRRRSCRPFRSFQTEATPNAIFLPVNPNRSLTSLLTGQNRSVSIPFGMGMISNCPRKDCRTMPASQTEGVISVRPGTEVNRLRFRA